MDSKQRFGNMIAQLSVNYRRDLSEADIANFKLMFKQWGIDALEQAVQAHMFDPDDGKYFPNIANIAKYVTGTAKQNQQLVEDRAEMAWACIEREISRIGSYGTLELEDKQAIAAVKAIGGWRALCMCTYDQLVWKKKEFISSYDCYERTPLEALPSKLPGLIELSEHKAESQQGVKSLMDGLNEYRNRKGIEKK